MDIRDFMAWVAPRGATPAGGAEQPFRTLQTELNRLFDTLLRTVPGGTAAATAAPFMGEGPRLDVAETEAEIKVSVDLPGLEQKNIEVLLGDDNLLTIKGERKAETQGQLLSYRISERAFGSFSRSIELPEGIDTDAVSAAFKNGVLTITISKTQEAVKNAKRIAVKTE